LHAFARRALACVLLACVCALPATQAQSFAPIPALTSPAIDTTGTLDAQTIARLEQQAFALQQRKGSQLQILMVPTTQPEDVAAYAQRAFDQWKLGREKVDDAVLIVVAKNDRAARIHTGYGLEGAIPDITAGRVIQEYMVPKFREGDYAGGLEAASAQLVKLIDGEPLPEPMSKQGGDGPPMTWPVGIFIAFFAAMFARGFVNWLPRFARAVLAGGGAGVIAMVFSGVAWVAVLAAVLGLFLGLMGIAGGRYVRRSTWGGFGGGSWGGSSGGGWSSGGGGGWSGGGGSSGGGGASGSW
jgi:uncharacterized protein